MKMVTGIKTSDVVKQLYKELKQKQDKMEQMARISGMVSASNKDYRIYTLMFYFTFFKLIFRLLINFHLLKFLSNLNIFPLKKKNYKNYFKFFPISLIFCLK